MRLQVLTILLPQVSTRLLKLVLVLGSSSRGSGVSGKLLLQGMLSKLFLLLLLNDVLELFRSKRQICDYFIDIAGLLIAKV